MGRTPALARSGHEALAKQTPLPSTWAPPPSHSGGCDEAVLETEATNIGEPPRCDPTHRPLSGTCPGRVRDLSRRRPAAVRRARLCARQAAAQVLPQRRARQSPRDYARSPVFTREGPKPPDDACRRTTPAPLPLTPPRPTPCAGNDAYRLKVWFNSPAEQADKRAAAEHAAEPGHEAAPTEAPAIAAI